ncbi:MAG: SLBB domain-containing protein [Clostridia bacterium]|nr:SLBB domain-containing protein [Clostridia bacterium]
MELTKLIEILRNNGIVGCGGAGFPSYAKINKSADTIILNCAECEPLLRLHRQVMEKYAYEIMTALEDVAAAIEAENVIIAIKPSYESAVNAVKANLSSFKHIKIGLLPEVYPAGDEVVTIYETTGRVVPPGSIPIAVGCVVYNVETMLNAYNAIYRGIPVTEKYVTVCGEVKNPVTLKVPLGMSFRELIELAGGVTTGNPAYICGGPMMGTLATLDDVVTKTTSNVLVIPENSYVVQHRKANIKLQFNRAKSVCCDCYMCTDLCPRHLLGHPISPAAFMTAGVSFRSDNTKPFLDTLYCCACGVCELYACNQGLSPRTLIGECKSNLRRHGVAMAEQVKLAPVSRQRPRRMVSKERLTARLGLAKYDVDAPLDERTVGTDRLKLLLGQHIGAPCQALVKEGDTVKAGDVLAKTPETSLGVALHAPRDGRIESVTDKFIVLNTRR